jgi:hypothetical protein
VEDPDYNPGNPPSVPNFGFEIPDYNDPRIYTMVLEGSPFATPSNGKTTYYMSFRCANTQRSDYGTEQKVIVCNAGYHQNGNNCDPNTYTVRFNANGANGGSMADQTHTYNSSLALRANAYTRTPGYSFKGWSTTSNPAINATVSYSNQQTVSNLTSTN